MQHCFVSRNSMRARTSKAFFAQGLFETAVDVTHHSFSVALLCSSSTVELLATVLQLLEHTKKDNDVCLWEASGQRQHNRRHAFGHRRSSTDGQAVSFLRSFR
jgi:hypothetical protein